MDSEERDKTIICPECGAQNEPDAKFCTECAAPLSEEAAAEARLEARGVKPWAVRFSERFKRLPWSIKYGIPIGVFVIIALIVTLFVIAGGHSPSATLERYFTRLQNGDYEGAYELVARQGGKFSSFEFFEKWQDLQGEKLGKLLKFTIRPTEGKKGLFGGLFEEEPVDGTTFNVTLKYEETSYDVNVLVKDVGGVWPTRQHLLELSQESSRAYVSPKGAKILIDGMEVGTATEDEDLQEALSLGELPDSLDSAIEYARTLIKVLENFVDEVKRLARGFDDVVEGIQRVFNKFGEKGVTWTDVTNSVDRLVAQSKEFGADVARTAIQVYWMFGGGDDGSLRAELTRTSTGMDLTNLPEGYHEIEAVMTGAQDEAKEFYAPDNVDLNLKPSKKTEGELKAAVEAYYRDLATARGTADATVLSNSTAGDLLDDEVAKVSDLALQGLTETVNLTSLKFEEYKLLSRDVATVKTQETWNYTTYQGRTVASSRSNVKSEVVYTLQKQEDGTWKVIEKKVD